MKKALIIGISGQDGAYLSRLLLEKGYEVCGTSRDAEISRFEALRFMNVHNRVQLFSMSLTDFRSILQGHVHRATIIDLHSYQPSGHNVTVPFI